MDGRTTDVQTFHTSMAGMHAGNIHVIPIASFMLDHEVHTHTDVMGKLNGQQEEDGHLIGICVHVFCAFAKFSNSQPTDRPLHYFLRILDTLTFGALCTFVHIISAKQNAHTHTNPLLFFPLVPAFTCHLIKSARAWIIFFLAPILYEFNFCAQSFLCRCT